jgi:hypothetical protein
VLTLIRGGKGVEDWTDAAAEPSILRHGWGGRNARDFLVDGSVEAARPAPGSLSRVQKVAVDKLGKFKQKYQGKHVILLCLNLYSMLK